MKQHDIFISYRREGGEDLAARVREALRSRSFSVFMDVEDLKSGKFDDALLKKIEEATDFLVILTPGCLERCRNEDDWLRQEIRHAISCQRNIVPILARNFQMPPLQTLPLDIADLSKYNGLSSSHELFEASIDRLVTRFLKSASKPSSTDILDDDKNVTPSRSVTHGLLPEPAPVSQSTPSRSRDRKTPATKSLPVLVLAGVAFLMIYNARFLQRQKPTGESVGRPLTQVAANASDGHAVFVSALELDGINDYVEVSADVARDLPQGTLEAWFRLDRAPKERVGLANANQWGGWCHDLGINIESDCTLSGTVKCGEPHVKTRTKCPIGQWVHVALTWSAAERKQWIYFNGKPECSGSDSRIAGPERPSHFTFGCWNSGNLPHYSEFAPVTIDQVRLSSKILYTGAFKPPEVLTAYAEGFDIRGIWLFDDRQGDTVRDALGKAHGRVVGNPRWFAP